MIALEVMVHVISKVGRAHGRGGTSELAGLASGEQEEPNIR